MTPHLRPTLPQSKCPADVCYIEPAVLYDVLARTGLCGLGLYMVVLNAAQHDGACSHRDLAPIYQRELLLCRPTAALLEEHLVTWVVESEKGGAQ